MRLRTEQRLLHFEENVYHHLFELYYSAKHTLIFKVEKKKKLVLSFLIEKLGLKSMFPW